MKKAISILLAAFFLTLTAMLAGCGETPAATTGSSDTAAVTGAASASSETEKKTETTASSAATAASSATGTVASSQETTASSEGSGTSGTVLDGKSKHPDFMDVNFGGRTFRFAVNWGYQADWDCYEIKAESTGNDTLVTEGIIERNNVVESLYNCKIDTTLSSTPQTLLSDDLALGTSQYDFGMIMTQNGIGQNYDINIASLDIDLTHDWWDRNYIENFSYFIDGSRRLYGISGKFNLISYDATWALFFNKKLYEQLLANGDITVDLYQTVRDGNWTIDTMLSMMEAAKKDTNGDSKYVYADKDIFGCTTYSNMQMAYALFYASGYTTTIRDASGNPTCINSGNTEIDTVSGALDKAISLWTSPYFAQLGQTDTQSSLTNGQSLFISEVLALASRTTDENAYFSLVPFPKMIASQADYAQYICTTAYGLVVSASTASREDAAKFLEVFGFHSAAILYPSYIQYLKTQCFCDEEAGEMLEIILRTRTYDVGHSIGTGLSGKIVSFITTGKNQLSRAISGSATAADAVFGTQIEKIRSLSH